MYFVQTLFQRANPWFGSYCKPTCGSEFVCDVMRVLANAQGKDDPNGVIIKGLSDLIILLRTSPPIITTSGAQHGSLDPPQVRGAGRMEEKRSILGASGHFFFRCSSLVHNDTGEGNTTSPTASRTLLSSAKRAVRLATLPQSVSRFAPALQC
jgi:hypothetical protein